MEKLTSLISTRRVAVQESPFVSLPAELRNQTYEYVFDGIGGLELPLTKRPKSIAKKMKQMLTPRGKRPTGLSLLLTCKQIFTEGRFDIHGVYPAVVQADNSTRFSMSQILFGSGCKQLEKSVEVGGPDLRLVTNMKIENVFCTVMSLRNDEYLKLIVKDSLVPGFWKRSFVKHYETALNMRAALANVDTLTFVFDRLTRESQGNLYRDGRDYVRIAAAEGWIDQAFPEASTFTIKNDGGRVLIDWQA